MIFLKKENILAGATLITIGLLFCLFRTDIIVFILAILGIFLIGVGLYDLYKKNTTGFLYKFVIGVIILLTGIFLVKLALVLIGIFITAFGIIEFSNINETLRVVPNNFFKKALCVMFPIIKMVVGLLLIINTFGTLDWIFIVAGILIAIDGVGLLFDNKEVKIIRTERL